VTAGKVTTLGTSGDGAVRRIERASKARRLPEKVASYAAALD
jgi:hypothetical protein